MNSENGMPATQTAPLFKEVEAEWMKTPTFDRLSRATSRSYKSVARYTVELGGLPIDQVSPKILYDAAMRLHNMPATMNMYRAHVNNILTHAFRRGYIPAVPKIPLKIKRPAPREPWDVDALKSALKLPNRDGVSKAMFIAYHTAQRISDVLALKWDQYDGTSLTFFQQKTGTHVRVPCSRPLKRMLEQAERRGDYIVQEYGKPFTYKTFYYRFRKDFPVGKFPCFHAIRHSAASRLAGMGASPHEIKSITGHKSLSSVQRYTESASLYSAAKKIMKNYD